MVRQPRVSIVTPSFNQGPWIEATIRSVLEQDYPEIEYVVMDGGSTDGTLDILKRYDGRLRWVSERDAGQSDAIKRGLAGCSGDIFTWLNSDDTLESGAVRTAVDCLNSHPDSPLVYGQANFIDPQGQFIAACAHIEPFNRHRLLCYSDYIVQPAAFFRRSAYEAVGGVDPALHFAMDYDLWLKLQRLGDFQYIGQTLANYRWFGGNKSALGGQRRLDEVTEVARRHQLPGVPAFFRLEAVRHYLAESIAAGKQLRIGKALGDLGRSIGAACEPRALRSALSPQTWRIINTGRKLRQVK